MIQSTSIEAYFDGLHSGLLRGLQKMVFDDVRANQGTTQAEVARRIGKQQRSITPRFAVLVELDALEIAGKRACTVTGRKVLTYRTTGREPRVHIHVPRKTRAELLKRIEELEKIVETLRAKERQQDFKF